MLRNLAAVVFALLALPAVGQPFLVASGESWRQGGFEAMVLPSGALIDVEAPSALLTGLPLEGVELVVVGLDGDSVWTSAPGIGLSAAIFEQSDEGVVVSSPFGGFDPVAAGTSLASLVARPRALVVLWHCPKAPGCPADVDPSIFGDGFESGSVEAWE
jgi:hypothetical protein